MKDSRVLSVLSIAVAIVIVGFLAYQAANTAIKSAAVDGCAHTAITIKSGEFIQPIYQSCLTDKGYIYEKK